MKLTCIKDTSLFLLLLFYFNIMEIIELKYLVTLGGGPNPHVGKIIIKYKYIQILHLKLYQKLYCNSIKIQYTLEYITVTLQIHHQSLQEFLYRNVVEDYKNHKVSQKVPQMEVHMLKYCSLLNYKSEVLFFSCHFKLHYIAEGNIVLYYNILQYYFI